MPLPFGFQSAAIRKYVRSDTQRDVARRQAEALQRGVGDTRRIDELIDRRNRREGATRIRRLPGRVDRETVLVVTNELLARTADLDAEARAAVTSAGYVVTEVDALRGKIVRIEPARDQPPPPDDGAAWSKLSALRSTLSGLGVPTSLVYVTPYQANVKSDVDPEEASGRPPVRSERAEEGGPEAVRVAVLDTGITAEQRSDGWLVGLHSPENEDPLDRLPAGPDQFLDLAAGHGTFATGIVQQVAPSARIDVVRVMDTDGVATELQVATALVELVDELLTDGGRLVVNLSLGSDTEDDQPPLALEAALDVVDDLQAERGGEVMVVAAAGNDGIERPCWPAAFDRVVAVAGLDQDEQPAPWSSHGPWVDCSVIGEAVLSTYVQGTELRDDDGSPETFGPDAWALWTGTSFAAPQVAGAVALIAQQEGRSLRWALQRLLAGRPRRAGYGRVLSILP